MKRQKFAVLITALVLASLACSIVDTVINTATGGNQNMTTVTQLWSDVPRMDGLTASNMDMPPAIKLIMETALGNLGRLNQPGQNQTTGNIDWIVFTTSKTATDVQNFYTPQRMKAIGWDTGDTSSCLSGSDQSLSQTGAFCVFQKTQGGKQVQLAIIISQDDQTKQTNVFFLRLETNAPTPTPGK